MTQNEINIFNMHASCWYNEGKASPMTSEHYQKMAQSRFNALNLLAIDLDLRPMLDFTGCYIQPSTPSRYMVAYYGAYYDLTMVEVVAHNELHAACLVLDKEPSEYKSLSDFHDCMTDEDIEVEVKRIGETSLKGYVKHYEQRTPNI